MLNPCDPCICHRAPCEQCMFGYRIMLENHRRVKQLILKVDAGKNLLVGD